LASLLSSRLRPTRRARPVPCTALFRSRMTDRKNDGLVVWTLSYLRPYRKRVALLALLLVSEIGLGTLQPWPISDTSRSASSATRDRKSTRLNSSHLGISYAVFCLKKKR